METSQHRPGSSAWPHGHCKNISSWHVKPSARRSWHVLPLQLRLHFWGRGADGGVWGGEGGVSGGDDGGGGDGGGGDGALRTERVTLRLSTRTTVTPRRVDRSESGRRARTASAVVASAAVRKSIDALTSMPEAEIWTVDAGTLRMAATLWAYFERLNELSPLVSRRVNVRPWLSAAPGLSGGRIGTGIPGGGGSGEGGGGGAGRRPGGYGGRGGADGLAEVQHPAQSQSNRQVNVHASLP